MTPQSGACGLDDVSLDVREGECLVLIGRSGAGKSSLLRCINRMIEPTSGSITVNDADVLAMGSKRLRELRRSIGMIFQEFNLVKRKRVLDNVLHGRLGYYGGVRGAFGMFPRSEKLRALDILNRLGMGVQALKRADQLSGGQKQRVAIARAIAQEPLMVLADEPVASLDPASSEVVLGYLRRICKEEGITAVVSLHQIEYARQFADRIVGLTGGRQTFDGLPDELNDDQVQTLYFENPAAEDDAA